MTIDTARSGSHSRGLVAPGTHTAAAAALLGLGVLALTPAPGAAEPSASPSPSLAQPAFVYKPARGFIDDPVAIDAEQGRLAVLRTDSASFAQVEIVDLASGKTLRTFKAGSPQQLFDRLLIAPGGGTVVITRDPRDGRRSAQYFSPDGRAAGLAGPATEFGTTVRGGREQLVGWDRKASAGKTTYTVTQYQLAGLHKQGARVYAAGKDGVLVKPSLKVVGWQDGYAQVMGQKPGGYDKRQDVRQPDKAAVLDALSGGLVKESAIGDVLGWAAAAELRRTRPNRSLMAVLSDEGDAVSLVDSYGRRTPLALQAKVANYQARSLAEQEEPGTLYFSLSLDPLNPDALARQKADKAYLDLYRVRQEPTGGAAASGGAMAPVLRVALDDRPVTWVAGDHVVALLRKHKSFSRGGTEIEVYRF
jgi:hypothetical protein